MWKRKVVKKPVEQKMAPEEEMLRATKAPEPGDLKVGSTVKSEEDKKLPHLTVNELTSAGWSYIWNTETGDRSLVNNNMLLQKLKLSRPNGSRVFATVNPNIKAVRGYNKCWLHADDPNRELYNSMGLPVCPKSNITSPFQVRQHMMKKHKEEFAAIEQQRNDQKEARREDLMASMIKQGNPEAALAMSLNKQ